MIRLAGLLPLLVCGWTMLAWSTGVRADDQVDATDGSRGSEGDAFSVFTYEASAPGDHKLTVSYSVTPTTSDVERALTYWEDQYVAMEKDNPDIKFTFIEMNTSDADEFVLSGDSPALTLPEGLDYEAIGMRPAPYSQANHGAQAKKFGERLRFVSKGILGLPKKFYTEDPANAVLSITVGGAAGVGQVITILASGGKPSTAVAAAAFVAVYELGYQYRVEPILTWMNDASWRLKPSGKKASILTVAAKNYLLAGALAAGLQMVLTVLGPAHGEVTWEVFRDVLSTTGQIVIATTAWYKVIPELFGGHGAPVPQDGRSRFLAIFVPATLTVLADSLLAFDLLNKTVQLGPILLRPVHGWHVMTASGATLWTSVAIWRSKIWESKWSEYVASRLDALKRGCDGAVKKAKSYLWGKSADLRRTNYLIQQC